jgi:hypothetical protein
MLRSAPAAVKARSTARSTGALDRLKYAAGTWTIARSIWNAVPVPEAK